VHTDLSSNTNIDLDEAASSQNINLWNRLHPVDDNPFYCKTDLRICWNMNSVSPPRDRWSWKWPWFSVMEGDHWPKTRQRCVRFIYSKIKMS